MVYLVDTNVIIRFLIGDHDAHLKQSQLFFEKIETGEMEVLLMESVLMESFFVLTKLYKLPKAEICNDLKKILSLEGCINEDKLILFETLSLIEAKSIDFVNALLCAKHKLNNFGILSFDNDLAKCIK